MAADDEEAEDSQGQPRRGRRGASSHFSGDDPEYVNPEIARIRREEQRRAPAAEEAEEAAAKTKFRLIVAGVVLPIVIVLWIVLF